MSNRLCEHYCNELILLLILWRLLYWRWVTKCRQRHLATIIANLFIEKGKHQRIFIWDYKIRIKYWYWSCLQKKWFLGHNFTAPQLVGKALWNSNQQIIGVWNAESAVLLGEVYTENYMISCDIIGSWLLAMDVFSRPSDTNRTTTVVLQHFSSDFIITLNGNGNSKYMIFKCKSGPIFHLT